MEVQTRNMDDELRYFETVAEAMQAAEEDVTIWKVSFGLPNGERVRLVASGLKRETLEKIWVYEPIDVEAIKKEYLGDQ